jgi:hypothetical protein
MPERQEVYQIVDDERSYQDAQREEGRFTEEVLPVSGEILCVEEYVAKLRTAYTANPGETPEECLHIFRKVAALCVRAMEHHGAPEREWPSS